MPPRNPVSDRRSVFLSSLSHHRHHHHQTRHTLASRSPAPAGLSSRARTARRSARAGVQSRSTNSAAEKQDDLYGISPSRRPTRADTVGALRSQRVLACARAPGVPSTFQAGWCGGGPPPGSAPSSTTGWPLSRHFPPDLVRVHRRARSNHPKRRRAVTQNCYQLEFWTQAAGRRPIQPPIKEA